MIPVLLKPLIRSSYGKSNWYNLHETQNIKNKLIAPNYSWSEQLYIYIYICLINRNEIKQSG